MSDNGRVGLSPMCVTCRRQPASWPLLLSSRDMVRAEGCLPLRILPSAVPSASPAQRCACPSAWPVPIQGRHGSAPSQSRVPTTAFEFSLPGLHEPVPPRALPMALLPMFMTGQCPPQVNTHTRPGTSKRPGMMEKVTVHQCTGETEFLRGCCVDAVFEEMTVKLTAQGSVCWEGAFWEAGQLGQRPLVDRGKVREHRRPGCLEESRRGQVLRDVGGAVDRNL